MPTYTYRCKKCEQVTEKFQKATDKPLVQCPACSQESLEKIITVAPPTHYKGSDWTSKGGKY